MIVIALTCLEMPYILNISMFLETDAKYKQDMLR